VNFAMTEVRCGCTGSPPWSAMIDLHAGGPNPYYLCRECGAVRDDIYQSGAIVDHRWHHAPTGSLPAAVRKEARGPDDTKDRATRAFEVTKHC